MKESIYKMSAGLANVHIGGPLFRSEVREVMRNHDVFVLSSNAFEGWGAVVNEALEEGMKVVGTFEAGASATILPVNNLFHSGDWRGLRQILTGIIQDAGIGLWTAESAARAMMLMIYE